jgi:hypothetical protein
MSDKFIIPKHSPNVVNTYNYKYPASGMNGIERRTVTKHVCVDSLFRKNYNASLSSNFSYVLAEPINNIVSMNVTAIEFPNAWYTFSKDDYSNLFTIIIYNAPSPADDPSLVYDSVITHVIEIPEGNYRADYLQEALNNIFSNTRQGLEYIYFEIDEINTHCRFRTKVSGDDEKEIFLDDSMPIDFSFTLDFSVSAQPDRPLYKNAGWMLGFREETYDIAATVESVQNITALSFDIQSYRWVTESESSYGSNVHNYIFLDIDDHNKNFNTNSFMINSEDYALGNNIIGRISVVSGMNTTVTNTANDFVFKRREYFGPIKLERLHIKLVNKLGEPINLNNNDFSFVLEIEQLYS